MMKETSMGRKLAVLALAVLMAFMFCVVGSYADAIQDDDPSERPGPAHNHYEVFAETSAINLVNDQKAGKYKLINTATMKSWVDSNKKMVIIDTMPANSYNTTNGHIAKAKNAEVAMKKKQFTKAEKKALLKAAGKNKKKTIVVYCGFTSCRRSHIAAAYLVKKGYKKVYRYVGGIQAWKECDYPVEKAETPAQPATPTTPAAETPATPAA